MSAPGWIFWSGTVGLESPLDKRFAAARAGAFTRISLSPLDVAVAHDAGVSAEDIARRAADEGVELVLDPVLNWHPCSAGSTSRFASFSRDDALRIGERLGVVSISAVAMPTSDIPVVDIAAPFAALCDRAADFGADVHLEFVPMTVVRDLATAWDIVRGAARPNGGIVFDTWHFFRGNPDFATLAAIPGDRIFAVQLDDAAAEVQGTLSQDTRNRLLPGDGVFDLPRTVAALAAIDALHWVGPEVISPQTEAMSGEQAGELTGRLVRGLVTTYAGAGA